MVLNHLYHLPSRQLRLVSNAIAGVAPSLINAVTNLHNPGQEGDSLLKHVQALTQHIQQALSISAPPICGCGGEQKPQVRSVAKIPSALSVRSVGSAKKGTKLEIPPQLLAKRYIFPLSFGGRLDNVTVVFPSTAKLSALRPEGGRRRSKAPLKVNLSVS
jgi:hypothetical protein